MGFFSDIVNTVTGVFGGGGGGGGAPPPTTAVSEQGITANPNITVNVAAPPPPNVIVGIESPPAPLQLPPPPPHPAHPVDPNLPLNSAILSGIQQLPGHLQAKETHPHTIPAETTNEGLLNPLVVLGAAGLIAFAISR